MPGKEAEITNVISIKELLAQWVRRPTVIRETVNEYQRDEDSVGDFIEQCCVVGSGFKVKSADVYSVFESWWQENVSKRVPLKKRFGQWFGKRFERFKRGSIWYHGVGLREDEEDP